MAHRRRGADFSDLLESFNSNKTDCGSALDSIGKEAHSSTQITTSSDKTYDGDRRINSKTLYRNEASGSGSFKSTILAGQAAESDSQRTLGSSYQTARSGSVAGEVRSGDTSLDSCQRSEAPSEMNRAITLQFSPQPELDLSETTTEPRSSGEMNRNVASNSEKSSDTSRDTNHNINGGAKELPSKSNAVEFHQGVQSPRDKFKPSTPRPCSVESKDAWSVLSSLDNILDPSGDKTAKSKQKILRRLSQEFLYSPRTFTERLVTIIDESETGYAGDEVSGVNLSRMTKEFRKMCKFIQDESMPEMAPSLCANSILGTPRYPDGDTLESYERPATIVESPTASSSVDCNTPQPEHDIDAKKVYRKTPLNIFKKTFPEARGAASSGSPGSPGSPNSTRNFEYWEKYCEGLPCSPKSPARNRPLPLQRSLSTPDISEESKQKLMHRREELLRSLDDTNPVGFETFESHQGRQREIEPPSSTTRNATYVRNDENRVNQSCAEDAEINEDELSNSLLIEKEVQRQRCFETAILMQEIEEDAKKTKEEYPKALERHGIDVCTAFMNTITTCMAYQNCLSGMRQSSQLKRKKGSSVDSGIDTRSFGRTLYASSKKSFNEASERNSHKQSQNYRCTTKDKRPGEISSIRPNSARLGTGAIKKTDRKVTSAGNLYEENTNKVGKQRAAVSPRRSAVFLRPTAKSWAQSRSPSREKRSPTRQIPSKTRAFKAPETSRPNKIRTRSPVPEIVLIPSTPKTLAGGLISQGPGREKQGTSCRNNTPTSISQRAKSPSLTPSSRPSPSARTPSKDRVPKLVNRQSEKKDKSPRNRFFVTPGRTLPVKKRKTKTYFPTMDADISEERSQRIMRSLHAPGLYRFGYETVVSPVRMYIRGTDVNLIHNNHERKNEMMLTPNKLVASEEQLKYNLASKTPRVSPQRNRRLFVDNEGWESDDNDGNIQDASFALPKANYSQPTQVHTVNENPKLIHGARTRGLLQSTQNRVVIRHEAKRLGKDEDSAVPESSSDSLADTSIHVLKSAEKTNFMSRRKL